VQKIRFMKWNALEIQRTVAAAIVWVGASVSDALSRHNILLVIGDDIGIDSLTLFNNDSRASFPPTPHPDELAAGGVLFSNTYAYPTCSPTHSTIMTGRYGFRIGVLNPNSCEKFHADEYILPEYFIDNPRLGYKTASVGKWHLGGDNARPNVLWADGRNFPGHLAAVFRIDAAGPGS